MANKTAIMMYDEAKEEYIGAINHILSHGIPAYFLQGIIESVLPEIRQAAAAELNRDTNLYFDALAKEEAVNTTTTDKEAE